VHEEREMSGWKYIAAIIGLLVVVNGTGMVVRAFVKPHPPDERREASKKLMQELYQNSEGKMERLTPEQKQAAQEFKEKGVISDLSLSPKIAVPTDSQLEAMSLQERVQALYNKSRGRWENLTPREREFIRKQWGSQGDDKVIPSPRRAQTGG
jgi:hypothetical protein